ncbi:MAG: putative major royal jelly-like protein [Tardiphaga sp.]|nr:putative major royal jelly-like protein [Tardiphaga sp.]
MNRRQMMAAMTTAALLPVGTAVAAGTAGTVSADTAPVGSLEVVAQFHGPGPSGIVVTPEGRIFVSFPRHAENHSGATLAELRDGQLLPFPNAEMSLPSSKPAAQRLLSVHGMTLDQRGRLWAIDDGKLAGQAIPPGGAKVVGFDGAGQLIASVVLAPPALLHDSHMNDLRVDMTHGTQGMAYVADSSFGTDAALVVVDIASGRQRRILAGHRSTQAEPGFLTVLEGKPLRYDPKKSMFPVGGVDSLALSTDSTRLYYSPLTSRRLYSIATALISNFEATEAELAAGVVDEGEKVMTDGMATDPQNRIYLTASEHDSIMRRNPDGSIEVVARDPRIVWPDGIFATATHVYCTLGQWNRLPQMNGGHDLRQPPYLLVRVPTRPAVDIGKA